MGYYVPNKVKPVCYNCPYRTNKYCGLLTEHDYLGDYLFNFEPYQYCPLIEVADRKPEPQTDYKKWEAPPKFEHEGIITTCVIVPMALIEGEPQTERSEQMTDRERIEMLERRVDFLEESLKETLKQANRIADLLIKGTEKYEPQPQTDYSRK